MPVCFGVYDGFLFFPHFLSLETEHGGMLVCFLIAVTVESTKSHLLLHFIFFGGVGGWRDQSFNR